MSSRFLFRMSGTHFLPLRIYQNLIRNWSRNCFVTKFCNFCILRSLKPHIQYQRPNFRFYARVNEVDDVDLSEKVKHKSQNLKKKIGGKILVIDENGKESSLYFNEAEKYAKSNRLRLVKLERPGSKKEVYKFEKVTNFILKDTKTRQNGKKFILRDAIEDHDLDIKINAMFKFVENGLPVICWIENVSVNNKINEVLSKLKASKLKDYVTNVTNTSKRMTVIFQKTSNTENKNIKTRDLKTNEST